jgi:hypothetical protein
VNRFVFLNLPILKGTSIYSDFGYRAVSAGAARSAFLMGSAA